MQQQGWGPQQPGGQWPQGYPPPGYSQGYNPQGYPPPVAPQAGPPKRKSAALTIVLVMVGCVGACGVLAAVGAVSKKGGGPDARYTEPSRPVVSVTALQLHADYHANEVAADEKYKGKRLRVTGKLDSIDKDFTDAMVLQLSTGQLFEWVRAEMKDDQKSGVARLQKGASVRVLCEGRGMIIGSPVLDDCVLD